MNTPETLALAEQHVLAQEYEEADRLCRQAIDADPANIAAWRLLGKIAHNIGLQDVATEIFRHADQLSQHASARTPDNDVSLVDTTSRSINDDNEEIFGGNDAFVISRYLSTLETQPANIQARINLATFLLRIGKADDAVVHAFIGLKYAPDDHELVRLAFRIVTTEYAECNFPQRIGHAKGELRLPRNPKLYRFMEQAKDQLNASAGENGLQRFSKYAAKLELDLFDIACIGIFWHRTAATYRCDLLDTGLRALSFKHFSQVVLSRALTNHEKELFLKCLGYDTKSEREWNRLLFEEYVVPAIERAAAVEDCSLVTYLDQANFYFGFAQQPYTEEQWAYCSSKVRGCLERLASQLASKHAAPIRWPDAARPVVGFITQWAFKGISADYLLEKTIEGVMAMEPRPFDPVLYVTPGNYESTYVDVVRSRGIPVVTVEDPDPSDQGDFFLRSTLALRERLKQDGVTALVLMGVTESTPVLAGALRLAPVQIYSTVGFRQVRLPPYWHGYFAAFSLFKHSEIHNGRCWRLGPAYVPDPFPPEHSQEHAGLMEEVAILRRERFAGKTVLAAIGRPVKIQNDEFMDTLATILERNADASFLWTSPLSEAKTVQSMIDQRGISSQCVRLEWMNPRILGQLVDVHLDTFPFPNGHSMLETMYAGKSFVWMANDAVRKTHASCGIVMQVLEGDVGTPAEKAMLRSIFTSSAGESLLPAANSADEYVECTERMIRDREYRQAVGDAGRKFVTAFFSDKVKGVQAFAEHCLEIISEVKTELSDLDAQVRPPGIPTPV